MKRFLFLVFALHAFVLSMAQDSLVRGGYVEYTYLGNQVYEAKLSLYVSCPYPDMTPYIGCRVGADTLSGDSLVFVQETDITGIPAICPVQSTCSGDTNAVYGVMRLVWTRRFDLDTASQCNVLFFAYASRRAAGITTGSAGQPFYIDSWLNQCETPESSSPALAGINENGYMIYNQDYVLNYGTAVRGDFDSVSYAMAAGRIAPGSSISYSGNYSPTRPICYFGFPGQLYNWPAGFHLDPLTGQIMFRPTSLCFGPLTVEISFWKYDSTGYKVVSRLYREQAVQVVASNGNSVPKILAPYSTQVCAGQERCFDIRTDDYDASDSVFLSIDSGIPGLSYTIDHSQSRFATARVCWTPDSSFISNVPYTFLAKAKDDHCDLPGTLTRAFSFFVREVPKAQTSVITENCGRVILSAIPLKNYTGMSLQWKIMDTSGNELALISKAVDTLTMKPGKYKTVFSISTYTPCTETYYDSFEIVPHNQVKIISDDLFCFGDSIQAQASNPENHTFTYEWSNSLTPSVDTASGDLVNYWADSAHYLYLTVKWGGYCSSSDSFFLDMWRPVRELSDTFQSFCFGDSTTLSIIQPIDSFMYQWSTGDTTDNVRVSSPGWYSLVTTYFKECRQVDSIEVIPDPLPVITFLAPDTLCFGDTVSVKTSISGAFPLTFLWQDSSTSDSVANSGGISVLQVTDAHGCRNTDSVYIATYVQPVPDTNFFAVCPGQGFRLFSNDSSGLTVYYSFGDTGNYGIPDSSGPAQALVVTDKGCESVFQIDIVVNELPDPAFSYTLLTARSLLFIPAHQWNAYYSWDFGDSTSSSQMIVNHNFNTNGPFLVGLNVIDRTTGCADSSSQQLLFHVGLGTPEQAKIQAFPNPFTGWLNLQSQVAGHCRIYSALGNLVWEGIIEASMLLKVDASAWKPGVYIVRMETETGTYSERIIHE